MKLILAPDLSQLHVSAFDIHYHGVYSTLING